MGSRGGGESFGTEHLRYCGKSRKDEIEREKNLKLHFLGKKNVLL